MNEIIEKEQLTIENMIYEGNNEITACGIKTLISIE